MVARPEPLMAEGTMRMHRGHWGVLLALLVGAASPAWAQYFGTNKVQFRTFQFQILETEHFDVYFYPAERQGAEIAARLSERWYARLRDVFGHELRGRQPLVLYASHVDFEQTNVVAESIGEGTGGLTEPVRRRIVIPLGGTLADIDHVLGHELVHAFQYDMTSGDDTASAGARLAQLPLWFVEGLAEYVSVGPVDPHTAMWLRDAVGAGRVPDLGDLSDPQYFPYRWGHAFWAYVCGRWSDQVIPFLLLSAAASGSPELALEHVLGVTSEELTTAWHAAIEHAAAPSGAAPPSATGTRLIGARQLGGSINVGPAISPDGRWVAFLSERSVFAIDLFVADAETGRVVRKLTDTASDPHYSSLQFIASAGAWDAESRRLAVGTVVRGTSALTVFEWPSARRRDIVLEALDEVLHPTWSPDGQAIAFTGLSGGVTDLFVYDLAGASLRRLTRDAYSDLQPAWSPDGRRLAFVTDRFSTDLATLDIGAYGLALVDPGTGAIESVAAFPTGKHISPQWSADGSTLYFVSDQDGISNLYALTPEGGELRQLTRVSTGVTGITASSPSLSVAGRPGVAVLTLYDDGAYTIHRLPLDGLGQPPSPRAETAGALPPLVRKPSLVAVLLSDARRGLPEPTAYPVVPYRSRLGLESVGQTMIGIGVDRFGPSFGAGIGLAFSDMLNNHRLATVVQFNSSVTGGIGLRDTAAQGAYVNQTRRWNWGIVGGQIPYLSGGALVGTATFEGQLVQVEQTILQRQTERSTAAVAAYPLDRARRVEVQTGVTHVSFSRTVRTDLYALSTGRRVFSDTSETSLADPLTITTASGAFVSDRSQFGATSPVQGERYRMEVAPAFGTVRFTSLLGDYRKYVMPVPFYTIAARILHYGRYGSGSEDSRLVPLYLGYPTLVRGYDVGTIDPRECVATAASACPVFDRLLGSRMLLGNLELRFPLLRPFGASAGMYGPLPVEVALFADSGVAWTQGERPSIFGGSRGGVSSAGVTLRVNLLGFAVGQFDVARPFERRAAGWVMQFTLAQGF
jgi:hypothetical protein